ncbi:MAG: hypothetical protein ORN98_07045 [Alphaproteobacteria bacterium]|nr:hypothetical protein [Alphaproteobacteria bacterium]
MADSQRNSDISDDGAKRMIRCSSVADFYSPPAHTMINTMLRAFLDQLVITPTELLHSVKYQSRLDQSGALLQDAIERAGSLQARAYGESGPTRVRELADLVTNVMLYLRDAEQKRPAGTFKAGGLNDYIRASKQQASGDQIAFRVNRGLTENLTEFRTWALKIDHLIALGEEIARDDFSYIDNVIGEALHCDVVQDNLFGRRISVEDRVDDLIELYLGVFPKRKKTATPTTQRLVALIKKHDMSETKHSIETVIINFLSSRDVLFSPELLTELKACAAMYGKLHVGQKIIGGPRAIEALERRISRLLTAEAVTDYIRGTVSLGERMLALFEIYAHTIGAANLKRIEEIIDRYFKGDDFGRRLLSIEGNPEHKLRIITQLFRAVAKSTLTAEIKASFSAMLVKLQRDYVLEVNIFADIERKLPNSARKLIKVVTLCHEGCFIPGENLDRAKAVIKHYLSRPDFMERYLEGSPTSQRNELMDALKKRLTPLGIPVVSA